MKRSLYILGLLSDSDIDWMIAAGHRETVAPGSSIVQQGMPLDNIYLICNGRFAVTVSGRGQPVQVSELSSGEIVGEISLLDSRPPTATVSAIEKGDVIRIPKRELLAKLDSSADFAARFYKALAVFLAARLRPTVARLGHGNGAEESAQAAPEEPLDDDLLDSVDLAGKRFLWIMDRLQRSQ